MASSKRPWMALPLFTRIHSEKGASGFTNQTINRDVFLKGIPLPSLQPQEVNSLVQVPALAPSTTPKERQETSSSRQLPFPTASPPLSWFDIPNTSAPLDEMQLSSVPSSVHQYKIQAHRTKHQDPTEKVEVKPYDTASDSKKKNLMNPSNQNSSTNALEEYGIPLHNSSIAVSKAWCCGFPGCNSQVVFTRACDLHKHYKRHSQRFYCRKESCSRSAEGNTESNLPPSGSTGSSNSAVRDRISGGSTKVRHRWFASKKDRDRHEAKHSPRIQCTWRGTDGEHCPRVFSRLDNMKDHIRRVHKPPMDHLDEF